MPNPLGRALRNRRAGQDALVWANSDVQAVENFTLTSPAFKHGTPIPERFRGHVFGPNVSPALAWSVPPTGTEELLLIVQDADAPGKRPATHALTRGIAANQQELPENPQPDRPAQTWQGTPRSPRVCGPRAHPVARATLLRVPALRSRSPPNAASEIQQG